MHSIIKHMKLRYQSTSNIVLLVSIAISTILPLFIIILISPVFNNTLPSYSDFIAGITTWDGYDKRGDMTLFTFYMAIYLMLMFILPVALSRIAKRKDDLSDALEKPGLKNQTLFFLLCFTVYCVVGFVLNKTIPHVTVLVSFSLIYYILKVHDIENVNEAFIKLCLISVFGYFAITAGGVTLYTISGYTPYGELIGTLYRRGSAIVLVAFTLAVFILAYFYAKKTKDGDKVISSILFLLQIPLPALFLTIYNFGYDYQGTIVSPEYSVSLRNTLFSIVSGLILYNIYAFYRYLGNRPINKKKILLTTAVSLTAFIAFEIPQYSFLSDFFHAGEHTTPLYQLIQFGSLPYRDIVPMHGLMNYALSMFGYVFFSGNYSNFPQSEAILYVPTAVVLCLVIHRYTKGEIFPFILTVLIASVSAFHNRFFAILVMLIILHSKSDEQNPLKLLWWWVLTSIFAVAWNPPFGGAVSISFIPIIIYSFVHNRDTGYFSGMFATKSNTARTLISWAVLASIGIMFIPMFIDIVRHTLVNAGSNLEAYGTSAVNIATNEAMRIFGNEIVDISFTLLIRLLGFTIVIGFLFIVSCKSKTEQMRTKSFLMLIQYSILIFLMSNYMIGRADVAFGRAALVNMVLFTATAAQFGGYAFKNAHKSKLYSAAAIVITATLAITAGEYTGDVFTGHKSVWLKPGISSDYIEFDGETADIPNLGTFYASPYEIDMLQDIQHVLEGEHTFLNLGNHGAYHYIFGKKQYDPFSSIYNTMNGAMHYRYIEAVKDDPPDIALVYPGIAMDGVPLSLRAYPVYRWLLSEGYRPFRYYEIVFLMSEDAARTSTYERADAEFMSYMRRWDLGYLPALWGNGELPETRVAGTGIYPQVTGMHNITEDGGVNIITGAGSYIDFQLELPISGIENDFINLKIESPYDMRKIDDFYIAWANEGEPFHEDDGFLFKGNNGTLLIPMASSPAWALSENIAVIRLILPDMMVGMQLPGIHMELQRYIEGWD